MLKFSFLYRSIQSKRRNSNKEKFIYSEFFKTKDTVIDCGENIAYYTNFIRTIVGKRGCVHALEPVPSIFEYLTKNAFEYSNSNNYFLDMVGLYKEESTKNIYIPGTIS